MDSEPIESTLDRALRQRVDLLDPQHEGAFRLFNGFQEGCPGLSADVYATTLVLYNYENPPERGGARLQAALEYYLSRLPWIQAAVVKSRNSASADEKRGRLVFGTQPDRRVCENGIWYALDLCMNQDASFYLDTRELRLWATRNLSGKTALNTFAYTGSLGVAALAGGARRVIQLDRNRRFLDLAVASYRLNDFSVNPDDFLVRDFYPGVAGLKREGARFDCVFLDPPFFSSTSKGVVDLAQNSARLINKVRPLINDGGTLVAVNNALFVSGKAYLQTLEALCADGYLEIEALIRVPPDSSGYPETHRGEPVSDPAPFNHATKIAVLRVRRKAAD